MAKKTVRVELSEREAGEMLTLLGRDESYDWFGKNLPGNPERYWKLLRKVEGQLKGQGLDIEFEDPPEDDEDEEMS